VSQDKDEGESARSETAREPALEKARDERRVPTVALGSSAGGLEALKRFFGAVPADTGTAFVVVTHTQPERESLLPSLLAEVAPIPVIEGAAGTAVVPDQVVVLEDPMLIVTDGKLGRGTQPYDPAEVHHPIDHFFRSLSLTQGEHAVGIVLSGSGNDGTLGIKAIKAAGGMVMVQDPSTAKTGGMPSSAEATGLADYVLAPEDMPQALISYTRRPFLRKAAPEPAPWLPDDAIQSILVSLRRKTGHDFTCYKKSTMSRRIERRMSVHHIDEPQTYVQFLRDNPHELHALLQELLVSVTSFFRDPEAYEVLSERAIPKLLEQREEADPLRVWVPGCATGEEAYSIAIVVHEKLRELERSEEIQIFATDLDEKAIEVARNGVYPGGIANDVSQERLESYFSHEDSTYRVHKTIRDMIVFAVQNVLSDPPFTHLDLIVCRNLLIYLSSKAQQLLLSNFHYGLRRGGLLFLGSSESLGESKDLFEPIDAKHRILRRRETYKPIHPALHAPRERAERAEPTGTAAETQQHPPHLGRRMEQLLLEKFVPCSVAVDQEGTVVYLHGRAGAYFEPEQGEPRNNVVEMARAGLRPLVSRALRQVDKNDREVTYENVRVETNGGAIRVDLTARYLISPPSLRGLTLLTVEPSRARSDQNEPDTAGREAEETPERDTHREELERELQYTRENLQSTIEELETRNEELQSSNEEFRSTNEELQSANEELETSKEELQSLNEELNTVNAELKAKVDALARSRDDMSNLLNSMQVGAVFLDTELKVKRYTNQARDVIRLIETDIGRPLSDLTRSLEYPELEEDCRCVLDDLAPREREVRDEEGGSYLVRVIPYRTAENVIDGLVITIVDIGRVKRAEERADAVQESRDFFESVVQTLREPLLVLDGELNVVMANDAFRQTFGLSRSGVEGRRVYELGEGQWNIDELRRLLEQVLPENEAMHDFRVDAEFEGMGRQTFLLNARELTRGEGRERLLLLAFETVGGEK
jgi:two-component system CheB/CheR fusion protein